MVSMDFKKESVNGVLDQISEEDKHQELLVAKEKVKEIKSELKEIRKSAIDFQFRKYFIPIIILLIVVILFLIPISIDSIHSIITAWR